MTQHCMLAQPYDSNRIKSWPVAVEPKIDGFRLLAHVICDTTRVKSILFLSRSNKEFTSLEHLREPLARLASYYGQNFILDGEITSGSFNETSSSVRKKIDQATGAIFTVFDVITPGTTNYAIRRTWLTKWLDYAASPYIRLNDMRLAFDSDTIQTFYDQARDAGYEGIIVKDVRSVYEKKRSYAWMKIKNYSSEDLKVIGIFPGEGKHEGRAGGLICSISEDIEVRVGTGFSDDLRQDIWDHPDQVVGRIIEVGYHEKTPAGSLRHPRFIRFRDTMQKGVKE